MQVEELYDLTDWIQSEIVDEKIVQKYTQLHKILQQNSQPNQQKQPFEDEKNILAEALNNVGLTKLSIGQVEILSSIGIANNIGNEGIDSLEDALFRNAIDIATAAQKVQQSIQEINSGVNWSKNIRELLSEIINTEEVNEIGDSVLLRVHFAGDAHLSNLTEFKNWGKIWWDIGRGIAMAHNEAPENIRVVGASKGSIIVSLLAAYGIAKTTSGIILEALKVAEKVLAIKKQSQEVKALQLANNQVENMLDEAAKNQKDTGIEEITENFVAQLRINKTNEGDKVKALNSAILKLVDFVEKGGEVDFVLPDDEEADEGEENNERKHEREELRVMFKEVRRLEKKVHQLEHKGP